MSVLIKGMEMPSRCNMCQLRDLCYDYYICRAKKLNDGRYLDVDDVKYKRHIKCPLVEVPTPHGRLIDADWVLRDNAIFADREFIHPYEQVTLREIIDDAPTVIGAEVSE